MLRHAQLFLHVPPYVCLLGQAFYQFSCAVLLKLPN